MDVDRELRRRVEDRMREWLVIGDSSLETRTSLIVLGRRGNVPVVVKVLRHPGDEWRSGEILDLFDGKGVVRVYEHVDGAVLMERPVPGDSVAERCLGGSDDDATEILAEVISSMAPRASTGAVPTVQDWAEGFASYRSSGDGQIPKTLLADGERIYRELCESQSEPRLLHGDLHHHNVLFDSQRGWLAIDPKGVVGEVEYEIGAALRNPVERPALILQRSTIEQRLRRFAVILKLNLTRTLAWGFAQAVLAAIWTVEDRGTLELANSVLALAEVLHPMIGELG